MQKYFPSVCQPSNFEIRPSLVKDLDDFPVKHLPAEAVYLVSDADARIAGLEASLKRYTDWFECMAASMDKLAEQERRPKEFPFTMVCIHGRFMEPNKCKVCAP